MAITIYEKVGLAMVFGEKLRAAITPEQFAEVNARNAQQQVDDPVCHSHDFCDANMVLLDAWIEFFGQEPDWNSDDDLAIINEAWTIAKAAAFFPERN